MNVYTMLDNELKRLHELLEKLVQLQYTGNMNSNYRHTMPPIEQVWERIHIIQEIILKSYQANDKELQLKIAETILLK